MLYPMFAMVLLTAIVGVLAVVCRIKSVKSGSVKIKYYRLMQSDDVPEMVIRTTRCFNNMFEIPVLFYAVSILFISLHVQSPMALLLAWGFVSSRCFHAFIHLTYNNVVHRMLAFWLAFVIVLVMWVMLVLEQASFAVE